MPGSDTERLIPLSTQAAERLPDYRAELLAFVAEIKTIFEPWQLEEHLATARQTPPFDPDIYEGEDGEFIEMERQDDLRRSAADLLVVEQARGRLLQDAGTPPAAEPS